jgi:hypothetical protein
MSSGTDDAELIKRRETLKKDIEQIQKAMDLCDQINLLQRLKGQALVKVETHSATLQQVQILRREVATLEDRIAHGKECKELEIKKRQLQKKLDLQNERDLAKASRALAKTNLLSLSSSSSSSSITHDTKMEPKPRVRRTKAQSKDEPFSRLLLQQVAASTGSFSSSSSSSSSSSTAADPIGRRTSPRLSPRLVPLQTTSNRTSPDQRVTALKSRHQQSPMMKALNLIIPTITTTTMGTGSNRRRKRITDIIPPRTIKRAALPIIDCTRDSSDESFSHVIHDMVSSSNKNHDQDEPISPPPPLESGFDPIAGSPSIFTDASSLSLNNPSPLYVVPTS